MTEAQSTPGSILNFRRWSDQVTLSGQPTEAQFAALKQAGVVHVINLGPYENEGALKDQPGCLANLGLGYTYIPVDFKAPTEADFTSFVQAFEEHSSKRLHIHCIYNARVSAFMMRFAAEGRGGDPKAAAQLMEGIWRPGGVWADFLGNAARVDAPSIYAGYDY